MAKTKVTKKCRVVRVMKPVTLTVDTSSSTQHLWQGKHPSVWSFWREGVSSSIISMWLTSLEEARLKLVKGLRSRSEPIYFAFGTCIHWVLEQAYELKKPPNKRKIHELVKQFEKLWLKEVPKPSRPQLEQQELVYGLIEVELPYYFKRWEGDYVGYRYPVKTETAKPKKWLALEGPFRVRYTFPDGGATWISGTRDGLFECNKKLNWVFDTKGMKIIKPDDVLDLLLVDLQMFLYSWATQVADGITPAGFVKNIVRRPGQIRGKDEKLKDYLARVEGDISNEKRWDHYFQRFQLRITPGELKEWKMGWLDPVMMSMRMWWEGKTPHFYNPLTLITKYGRCDTFNAQVFGDRSGLFKQKDVMGYQKQIG